MMPRYVLFISYIGTQFRAVQKQIVRSDPTKLDPKSIQGILEICAKRFKPLNEPYVYVSSRTDQGVHALRSAAHVDLERRNGLKYDPQELAIGFNRYFSKEKLDIRVQSVHIVPDTFHARYSVKSRTYLYRLAVRNPDAPPIVRNCLHTADIPFIEWNRCYFIQKGDKFDISLLKDAAALFPGTRDFRTFMGSKSQFPEEKSTVKEMYRLDITPGKPLLDIEYSPSSCNYTFWDITCQSRSFLYRQIRRIVGALIGVAQGIISIEEVKYMLDNPSKDSWNSKLIVAPPFGLYLIDVEYDPMDMLISEETDIQDCKSTSSETSQSSEVSASFSVG